MDPILRQKIANKLREYLNRDASDDEIVNGQTDATLMHWIAQDDAAVQNAQIAALGVAAKVDTVAVAASVVVQ